MNCEQFHSCLFDYLDGTLDSRSLTSAEAHLAGCNACQKLVLQQKNLAAVLSGSLKREMDRLVLTAPTKFRLLRELQDPSQSSVRPIRSPWGWRQTLWSGGILVAAVVILTAATGLPFGRHFHSALPAGPPKLERPGKVSVYVVDCVPVRSFSRNGDMTVDTLNCEPCVVEEIY